MPDVNIPLLRKAVEWAEGEAAKPADLCEWAQEWWITPPSSHRTELSSPKSPDCGTCYCIAGYVTAMTLRPGEMIAHDGDMILDPNGVQIAHVADRARNELGDSPQIGSLFCATNSIEDVRRIAEEIAGERL